MCVDYIDMFMHTHVHTHTHTHTHTCTHTHTHIHVHAHTLTHTHTHTNTHTLTHTPAYSYNYNVQREESCLPLATCIEEQNGSKLQLWLESVNVCLIIILAITTGRQLIVSKSFELV